MKYSRILTVLG